MQENASAVVNHPGWTRATILGCSLAAFRITDALVEYWLLGILAYARIPTRWGHGLDVLLESAASLIAAAVSIGCFLRLRRMSWRVRPIVLAAICIVSWGVALAPIHIRYSVHLEAYPNEPTETWLDSDSNE